MAIDKTRDSLIENIEWELKKEAEDLDPDFIDRRIDELYRLDSLTPPKLSDETLRAAARTVRARAAWRRRNMLARQTFRRRVTRGAVAACFVFLFLFSANYVSALLTGACLPSKVGIKICCGTKYCFCGSAQIEAADHSE